MLTKTCWLFAVLSCLLLGSGAKADESNRRFPLVGPAGEIYFLSSGHARDRFGSSLSGIGLGFGSVVPSKKARFSPDIDILGSNRNGNKALFVIAGVQYRRTFSPDTVDTARFVPYYGIGADVLYSQVKVPSIGQNDKGFGTGASLLVGSTLGRRAYVEARLRALSSIHSYNFSGLSLSAGIRF